MAAHVYNSRPLVTRLQQQLREDAAQFRQHHGRTATLASVQVGSDDAAQVYNRQLTRSCRELGVACLTASYPFETTEEELRTVVAALDADAAIDGVVLLLPLPDHIRQRVVTDVLRPEKDVDGLGARNAGNLMLGFPSFVPSTADVVSLILDDAGVSIAGKHAVIIGRSNIGGKPTALVLMRRDATVTLCHSQTHDLTSITREADILVVSAGRPALLTADMVRPGAIVLDAGINTVDGHVVGDVEQGVREVASFLTPVPQGMGPLTHLTLIGHTLHGPR